MKASEIRRRFVDYFQQRGHQHVPSGPLVPADDPTLLFTNAGMVQFKKVFLGQEEVPFERAVTVQKCLRAGGKHNDLEEVGRTARHHTFFEMLGNFSFGDYFKRDAIHFAWEFLTSELGLAPDRLFATVHHTDDQAYRLWQDVAGLASERIYQLGDEDNFWQMADTGPCGPCSELHYDLRPDGKRGVPSEEAFEELGEAGEILELWNLVFMQFDRAADGTLDPLPAPSIDTGAGLERLAAVLQETNSNYHTDLFTPLLHRVGEVVGRPYAPRGREGTSYRVLADHGRAVAFLLADGVFPSNEGRGYVLRRILRRGVRHAWLLGRREPTLVEVAREAIGVLGEAYPELREREDQVLRTTRIEEERFLSTIEGGMARFDEVAPVRAGVGTGIDTREAGSPEGGWSGSGEDPSVIPGDEAFKLYDTHGFPLDLTRLMAQERGYEVDEDGFERALEEQRARSRADRAEAGRTDRDSETLDRWTLLTSDPAQTWTGWDRIEEATEVLAWRRDDGRLGVILKENPFYAEAGGQVSDTGTVEGGGWQVRVDEVRSAEGRIALFGKLEGDFPAGVEEPPRVRARVDRNPRHDTERNHTATHILHAALRKVLGSHVTQRGSLVAPDKLRFDFSHPSPLTPEELEAVEREVNHAIWADHPVRWEITSRDRAEARGAIALFGEKYGEEVRVVEIPGVSVELCGGTHLRHTGEAGLFVILRESGVASGVRRIEAVTGPRAYGYLRSTERELERLARVLKTPRDRVARRVEDLLREREELERLLEGLRRDGAGGETPVHEAEVPLPGGGRAKLRALRLRVRDADDARAFGDAFREEEALAVAAVATQGGDGREAIFVFVTDDLIARGVKAGDLVREIAAATGGRGGGRPHMAQGGVGDADRVDEALRSGEGILRRILEEAG